MDQNEQKSVWLKLILPICLGIFAAAIYHNAIKTQRAKVTGFVAGQQLERGQEIEVGEVKRMLSAKELVFHSQTKTSIQDDYNANKIASVFSRSKLTIQRDIQKDEFVTVHDFK